MKPIKHSKIKNTGILFELLVRQITLEVLNGDKTEHAKTLVKEFFAPSTELNKELRLYELLVNEKYSNENRAERFIDTVLESHKRLNTKQLSREKYNLIKRISECFDLQEFFSSPIRNYKTFASVYKVFESIRMDSYDIKDVFNAKVTLIENITAPPHSSTATSDTKNNQLLENYKKQEKDLRLLTYKILIESFNKKYTNLDPAQQMLLREYINNINNTSKFADYVNSQVPKIVKALKEFKSNISDRVTQIKLNETITLLENINVKRGVKDGVVSALMVSYELIKELKRIK